ncbi:tape measure domain-containing protein [Janthinobacterium sp. 61]|nr:tape measure domain-containing protein [Janthinobacterium sp. 61]
MTQARRVVTETQDRINAAANAMKTALAGIGIGAGLAEIIKMADEYAKFTAQLRLASTSVADYAASYEAVKRIAKTSQQDLASTGVLYARIANGTRELGTTQKQVAAITETVNLALRVSGATATESASAQLQLSQAFASGTLRGEEFNAVNEAAPRLMKALADGMGLPVGALKAMAGEGQITSNIMATVLPKALESLREESKNIQTISGAFTVLKNEMLEFFGMQAQANGTVALITGAIRLLSENLGSLVIILKTLTAYQIGTWLATWVTKTYQQVSASIALRAATVAQAEAEMARTTSLVAQSQAAIAGLAVTHEATLVRLRSANADRVAAQAAIAAASAAGAQSFALRTLRIATAELAVAETLRAAYLTESAALDRAKVAALGQLTAATAAQVAAQAALNGVTASGITAAGVASKAIGFLGGPIGAIILLLGTAALAWEVFGKKSKEANEQAAESFEEAHARIIKALDTQIDKQQNLLQLKNLGLTNQQAEKELPIIKQLEAATKRMGDLNARAGDFAGISNDDAIFKRIELNRQINELLEKQAKATKGAADVAMVTGNEAYNEWKKTYATREEQRAAEIADLKTRNLNAEQYADILGRINLKYADKGATAGLKKEEQAYATLIASIREKIEAGRLENATDVDATESQKLRIKLEQEIKVGKLKLADAHLAVARAALDELAAEEKIAKARATEKDVSARIQESTLARQDSAAALAVEYQMMGKSSDARELAMVAVREQTALEKFLLQEKLAGKVVTDEQIKRLTEEAAARTRVEQATLAQTKALGYAAQLADENRRFSAESLFDEKARASALLKIDAAMWQERIALAGVGTDAQKRLQEEYSTWYSNQLAKPEIEANRKMWESIDTTAHDTFVSIFDSGKSAFDRLRDTLKNGLLDLLYQMTIKKWILNIGASVSGAGAAGLASAEGLGLSGGAAGGGLGGIASLAQSAKTAYTIATQGFSGVAAGIGGSIATLGNLFGSSAVSAFGTGMGLTGVQAATASAAYGSAGMAGTGSALTAGAAAAPIVAAAAGIAAGLMGGKLISGQYGSKATVNVGTGIGTVAGAIFGGPFGAAIGGAIGGVIGGIANRAFGMGDKKYGETGITGTLSGTGFAGNEYSKWTQNGGWLRSDKAGTDQNAVTATTSKAFVDTYAAIRQVSATLAGVIGVDTSALADRAQTLNINLTGLTTEADRLAAVTKFFEGVGDTIAVELVPNLAQFQVQGEALSATLQRVSQNYAGVDAALQLIGRTSQEAFGMVGASSIAARESLVKMAGGLDALSSGTQFFAENFLTIEQQMAPVIESVNKSLTALGMTNVSTTKQYADAVLKLTQSGALATESGQQLYLQLLALAPAFKSVTDYNEKLNKSLEEVAAASAAAAKAAADGAIAAAKAAEEAASAIASGLLSAVDAAFATLQTVVNREKTALAKANEIAAKAMQVRIDAETAAMAKHKSLADALKSSLDQMNVSGTMEDVGRASAQAQIAAALAIAKAGGPLPAADSLKDALSSVTKDASDKFATYDDYLVDFYRTQNDIAALGKLTDSSLSIEQRTLDLLQQQKDASQVAYEAEVARLDGILETARSQIDVLKGIDTTSLSILQAITGLASAMAAAQANSSVGALSGINNAYQAALGRAPEKAGMDYWGGLANSGVSIGDIVSGIKNSPEAQAQALYKSVMGRAGDAAGIDYWTNVLAGGSSIDQVRAAMMGSAEYQKLHSFDVGTNRLPFDTLALVHEGERIIPAADNRELMARLSSPTSNNDALAAELREQRIENEKLRVMLETHLYAIAKNTLNTADSLEGAANGDMPLTTKKVEETA